MANIKSLRGAWVVTAAALALGATGDRAQAQGIVPIAIGNTIGNMTQGRGGCATTEDLQAWKVRSAPTLDNILSEYAGAMAANDVRKARRVFKGPDWIDSAGARQNFETSPFGSGVGAPTLRRVALVMGGDYQSALGHWAFASAAGTDHYVAVDLERDFIWGRWKIQRLEVSETPPAWLPDDFCSRSDLILKREKALSPPS